MIPASEMDLEESRQNVGRSTSPAHYCVAMERGTGRYIVLAKC